MKTLSFTELHVLAVENETYTKALDSAIRMLQNNKPVYIYTDEDEVTVSSFPMYGDIYKE